MITVTALLRRIVAAYAARISVIDEILCGMGDFASDYAYGVDALGDCGCQGCDAFVRSFASGVFKGTDAHGAVTFEFGEDEVLRNGLE